ncbi:50S ribosomal protein L9 [Candidatus Pelagibacter sp.]|nr:50S ribosomal protein L9 [Candidatus Pelagibacter sp.]|tara:strand:- start:872 stop:1330 length:459 start_codon:yes stop_codon:yes gene_type:complete
MKVILLENIKKIGTIGEIINVKRGFARNYLIANQKALYASKDNIKQVDKIKVELGKKDLEKKKLAKQIMEKINNKIITVEKLVTENKDLYGSIKPTEISKLISENEKVEIKPSLIQPLKEIKSLGTFKVKIDLHSEVQAEIKIKVDILDQTK